MEILSAEGMARKAKASHPELRIGYTACGSAAGVWDDGAGRFIAHVEKTIIPECPWVRTDGRGVLVNGEPLRREWIEV